MSGILKAGDVIAGQEGMAYMEIDGRNEPMFYVKNVNGIVEKQKTQLRTLGKRGDQNKTIGWAGSGSMVIHKVTSQFVEMAVEYVKTGRDSYFNLTVVNDDPSSTIGSQRVVLVDVNLDSYPVALLDVDAEALEEEMDFTFDDLDLIESFKKPSNFA